MYITPVQNIKINNSKCVRNKKPAFTAHPDFYKYNSVQSCYFRRGSVLISCAKGYKNIETLFTRIFKTNENLKKQILIVGIGNSQEPFSYLASIKGIIGEKPLNKKVDLYTVDLQSKPEHKNLKENAMPNLFDYEQFPFYAERGFVKDDVDEWLEIAEPDYYVEPVTELLLMKTGEQPKQKTLQYRVNDEIFDFLETTYNNSGKSKWESRIQDVITDYGDEKFDIISANNVLPYIIDGNKILKTIQHIKQKLKPGGYFITDPYEYPQYMKDRGVLDNLRQVYAGIYQKV